MQYRIIKTTSASLLVDVVNEQWYVQCRGWSTFWFWVIVDNHWREDAAFAKFNSLLAKKRISVEVIAKG